MAITKERDIGKLIATSQQKAFSVGIFTVILLAFLTWFSVRPTILAINKAIRTYQERQKVLTYLKQRNANLATLINNKRALNSQAKGLDITFPYDDNFSLLVVNLTEGIKANGFRLENISFSEESLAFLEDNELYQYKDLEPVVFKISMVGRPDKLKDLLEYFKKLPFGVKPISTTYALSKASTTGEVNISLRLVVFKLSGPAAEYE